MTLFLLIRHGESLANRESFFAGQLDVPLEDKGLAQAQLTARFITDHYRVDRVYASDLRRAYDTGKAVADLLGLPVTGDPRLREINAGHWQGLQFTRILQQYPEDYETWLHDIGFCVCSGGESVAQLGQRIMTALTDLAQKHPAETVVIATHATPIRVMRSLLHPKGLSQMKDIPWVSNASVTELRYQNGSWEFGAVAQDAHLQDMKTTFAANV